MRWVVLGVFSALFPRSWTANGPITPYRSPPWPYTVVDGFKDLNIASVLIKGSAFCSTEARVDK